MNDQISLTDARQRIIRCLQQGALDTRVLEALLAGDVFIPKECELWDYKEKALFDRLGRVGVESGSGFHILWFGGRAALLRHKL